MVYCIYLIKRVEPTLKKKILAIGEIIWDVYPDKAALGGAPLNFAAHSVQCGAEASLISAVGADSLGEDAKRQLAGFGVDASYVKTVDVPTGQCLVTLDEARVPHYNVLRGVAYDNIKLEDADFADISARGFDALYFGTLIQREPVSRASLRRLVKECSFDTIICDVNLRPDCYDAESVALCMNHATVIKISNEEEPVLRALAGYTPTEETPDAIARAVTEKYPQIKIVIVTLGKDGSFAYMAENQTAYTQASIGDKVVSTVGAGDSFAAAWLTTYLNGEDVPACMKKAAEVSGFVVAHTEAVPKYKRKGKSEE